MSARRLLVWALLGAAIVAAALVLVLRDDATQPASPPPVAAGPFGGPVRVTPTVAPRIVLFGDTIQASVTLTTDRRQVVPGSLRFKPSFQPWGQVAPPVRERDDAGDLTQMRTTYTLRCIISPCVPQRATASLEFDPVVVSYRPVGSKKRETVEARWPVLVVHSQLVPDDFQNPGAVAAPWRADTATLPAVSYRVSPGALRWAALVLGALLALAGVLLAVRAIPSRTPKAEPPPPPPEPEPMLPPLEHALLLLEEEAPENGEADRRRALELVAEELEARGDRRIARRARGLAWSEDTPAPDETRVLAAEVRELIGVVEEADDEVGADGDPPA